LLEDDVLAGGLQLRRLILGQRVAAPHGTCAPRARMALEQVTAIGSPFALHSFAK
jgi:mannitol/fructose-specific phosphotransferase system IIA component